MLEEIRYGEKEELERVGRLRLRGPCFGFIRPGICVDRSTSGSARTHAMHGPTRSTRGSLALGGW